MHIVIKENIANNRKHHCLPKPNYIFGKNEKNKFVLTVTCSKEIQKSNQVLTFSSFLFFGDKNPVK